MTVWCIFIWLQVGSVRVGSAPNDPLKDGEKKRVAVTFPRPFLGLVPPRVVVTYTLLDVQAGVNTRVKVAADNVTSRGFELCVFSWCDSVTWSVQVTWVASASDGHQVPMGTATLGAHPDNPITELSGPQLWEVVFEKPLSAVPKVRTSCGSIVL